MMTLADIKTGDLFATPPYGWLETKLASIIDATTWHWGMMIAPDDRGWVITESIGKKGVALTRFTYPMARIYRIKNIGEVNWKRLISIVADYGDYPYDFTVAFKTAIWWLLKHYFGKIIPVVHDRALNCQELVVLLACELGVKIIPDDEYPMCKNLENSPYLEYIGEVNQ
jgi:hypothetical protein